MENDGEVNGRVGAAIKRRYGVSTYMPIPEGDREIWQMLARAAIEAAREPTATMLAGGEMEMPDDMPASRVWFAMIDAALA